MEDRPEYVSWDKESGEIPERRIHKGTSVLKRIQNTGAVGSLRGRGAL